jgi:hypothetical protein
VNFIDMQDHILGLIHEDHSPSSAARIRAKVWLNVARDYFISLGPWHFLATTGSFSLSASTVNYFLREDFRHLNDREVRLGTSKTRLHYLDDSRFALLVTDPTAEGAPQYFRLVGFQQMQLYPVPDASTASGEGTVTYEYYRAPTYPMAGDSDDTGLPAWVDPLILQLAECYAQRYVGNHSAGQAAMQEFMAGAGKLQQENSDILRIQPRDIAPALRITEYEQATRVDRS